MKNSKVTWYLRSMSETEIKRFSEFVMSPFFNKNKSLIRFADVLLKYYPEFDHEKISKERVYSKIFPGKKFNDQIMKNLISSLFRLCREFYEYTAAKEESNEIKILYLDKLRQKKLYDFFESEYSKFRSDVNLRPAYSQKVNELQSRLDLIYTNYLVNRNRQQEVFVNVLKSGESHIVFCLSRLLYILCDLKINSFSYNAKYEVNIPEKFFDSVDFESFIEYLKKNKSEYTELMEFCYKMIKCNQDTEYEDFYLRSRDIFLGNMDRLERSEIYGFSKLFEAYCTQKINAGNKKYYKELFELYNGEIKSGYYIDSGTGMITKIKFRNTYLAGLRSGNAEWTETFINDFKKYLDPAESNSLISMAYAYLYFEKKEFLKVIEFITKIRTEEFYLKIDIKNIMLMSYYELGYYENVYSLIDSYKHFQRNNEMLTKEYSDKLYRFTKSLHELMRLKEENNTEGLELLIQEIKPFRVDRKIDWVCNKIEMLIR